jgi:hypothetical protein
MSMKMIVILLLSILSIVLSSPSLIQSASDFFKFDYNRVDDFNNEIFRFFINPATPFFGVFLYLALSKPLFTYIRKTFNINPKGQVLQNIVVLHSALLALYSGWTMYHTWNIVWNYMKSGEGLVGAVCGVEVLLPAKVPWIVSHVDEPHVQHFLRFLLSILVIQLLQADPTLLPVDALRQRHCLGDAEVVL